MKGVVSRLRFYRKGVETAVRMMTSTLSMKTLTISVASGLSLFIVATPGSAQVQSVPGIGTAPSGNVIVNPPSSIAPLPTVTVPTTPPSTGFGTTVTPGTRGSGTGTGTGTGFGTGSSFGNPVPGSSGRPNFGTGGSFGGTATPGINPGGTTPLGAPTITLPAPSINPPGVIVVP